MSMQNNNRNLQRFSFSVPIQLSFGSQITLLGQLKDLSSKSAFINIRSSSIHMDLNDELQFSIANDKGEFDGSIQGTARISRVSAGEGIAIYFTKIDEPSMGNLAQLISSFNNA